MSEARRFIQAIQMLADQSPRPKVKVLECEVISVNEEDKTCVVKSVSIEDTEISNVQLQATNNDGFCLVPAIESMVLVSITKTKAPFIVLTSDIDKILCTIDAQNSYTFDKNGFVWNNGLNGGLVNINPLTVQLKLLDAKIDSLKAATGVAISVYSGALDGGASAATFNSLVLPTVNTDLLEDKNIKH